jgi:hypothetical protein
MIFHIWVANLQDTDAVTSLLEASYSNLLTSHYDPEVLAKALPIMTKANTRLLASQTFYLAHGGEQLVGCGPERFWHFRRSWLPPNYLASLILPPFVKVLIKSCTRYCGDTDEQVRNSATLPTSCAIFVQHAKLLVVKAAILKSKKPTHPRLLTSDFRST